METERLNVILLIVMTVAGLIGVIMLLGGILGALDCWFRPSFSAPGQVIDKERDRGDHKVKVEFEGESKASRVRSDQYERLKVGDVVTVRYVVGRLTKQKIPKNIVLQG